MQSSETGMVHVRLKFRASWIEAKVPKLQGVRGTLWFVQTEINAQILTMCVKFAEPIIVLKSQLMNCCSKAAGDVPEVVIMGIICFGLFDIC